MITTDQFLVRFPEFSRFHANYSLILPQVIVDTAAESDEYDWLASKPSVQELAQSLHTAHNYLARMREVLQIAGQSPEEVQRAVGSLIIKQDDDLYGRVDYDVSAMTELLKNNRNSPYWERLQNLLQAQTQTAVGFLAFGPTPFSL